MTLRSPLHEEHSKLGAKFTNFGGWDMPLQYSGVIAEHEAVRRTAGLFDVSHLGKLVVEGPEAEKMLDRLLPGRVAKIEDWSAAYNLVLNPDCGIVDDIFVYRHPDYFLLVPNASNSEAVKRIVQDHLVEGARLTEARERWAIIAFSGPAVKDLIVELVPEAQGMKMHRFLKTSFRGIDVMMARTGYTGEYTVELFVSWQEAPRLWSDLLSAGEQAGAIPTGLGCRDTLRLEMGYPLHGHEISEQTDPLESGLEWVIDWSKDFERKADLERLRDKGSSRRLVGLKGVGREIPRAGYPIRDGDSKVGEVTSGNFSPVLKRGIALGYVTPDRAAAGTMLSIDVRNKSLPVEVTKPPFIRG